MMSVLFFLKIGSTSRLRPSCPASERNLSSWRRQSRHQRDGLQSHLRHGEFRSVVRDFRRVSKTNGSRDREGDQERDVGRCGACIFGISSGCAQLGNLFCATSAWDDGRRGHARSLARTQRRATKWDRHDGCEDRVPATLRSTARDRHQIRLFGRLQAWSLMFSRRF